MCSSGDSTAKQAEQTQAQLTQQLVNMMQTQFGKQSAVTDLVTKTLEPMLTNPEGYDPATLAALRTSATEQNAAAYAHAKQAAQNVSFTQGGRELPSGVNDQIQSILSSNEASNQANSQDKITLANEQQKQQNFITALNGLNGVATQLNPIGYANSADSSGNATANLSNAVTNSQQSGLLNALISGGASVGAAFAGRK
jgi:hypothetical protein